VSSTSDAHCTCFAHCILDCRVVAKIQGKIVEKREQNLLSRLAHAGNDKHIITAWRLEPIRIIQAFDVRSAGSIRLLLTASFQTELALNVHLSSATVSLSWPIPTYGNYKTCPIPDFSVAMASGSSWSFQPGRKRDRHQCLSKDCARIEIVITPHSHDKNLCWSS